MYTCPKPGLASASLRACPELKPSVPQLWAIYKLGEVLRAMRSCCGSSNKGDCICVWWPLVLPAGIGMPCSLAHRNITVCSVCCDVSDPICGFPAVLHGIKSLIDGNQLCVSMLVWGLFSRCMSMTWTWITRQTDSGRSKQSHWGRGPYHDKCGFGEFAKRKRSLFSQDWFLFNLCRYLRECICKKDNWLWSWVVAKESWWIFFWKWLD